MALRARAITGQKAACQMTPSESEDGMGGEESVLFVALAKEVALGDAEES